jgi:hypothetical protein
MTLTTLTKEPARVPHRKSGPIKIAILGGDLLVGWTLEVALQGVGYDARFLNGSLTDDEPTELLDEVRLVIFAPRMSTERRKVFLSRVRGTPATARVPVLELVTTASDASENEREELVGLVSWPCPTEELEREIEAALLNGVGLKE